MLKKSSNSVKIFFPKFNREEVVTEISKRITELHEKLHLDKVIIFGSYAKGNYTVASDIDLLIVFDNEKINENEVYKCLMKSIQLPRLELHIISKKDFNNYKKTKWIKTIEEEGIKIL